MQFPKIILSVCFALISQPAMSDPLALSPRFTCESYLGTLGLPLSDWYPNLFGTINAAAQEGTIEPNEAFFYLLDNNWTIRGSEDTLRTIRNSDRDSQDRFRVVGEGSCWNQFDHGRAEFQVTRELAFSYCRVGSRTLLEGVTLTHRFSFSNFKYLQSEILNFFAYVFLEKERLLANLRKMDGARISFPEPTLRPGDSTMLDDSYTFTVKVEGEVDDATAQFRIVPNQSVTATLQYISIPAIGTPSVWCK